MRAALPSIAAILTLLGPASAAATTGGPDTYGYTFTDSAEPGGPAFQWTSGGSQITVPDDGSVTLALPFAFSVYGVSYTEVQVGQDGLLTLGAPSPGSANVCLPGAAQVTLAPYRDGFTSATGQLRSRSSGAAPSRIFVVSWDSVEHEGRGGDASLEVRCDLSGGTGCAARAVDGACP